MSGLEQLPSQVASLQSQMSTLQSQVLHIDQKMTSECSAVRQEIREGDQETRRFMRILHEDLVQRIETIRDR